MEYLRRFNEDQETEPVDCDYIRDCFIELIDSFVSDITNRRNFCYIKLNEPKLHREYNTEGVFCIDKYIDSLNKHTDFYLDVKNSIEKVHIKYSFYKVDMNLISGGILSLRIYDKRL